VADVFPEYSQVSPAVFGKYRLSHNEGTGVGVFTIVLICNSGVNSFNASLLGMLQEDSTSTESINALTIKVYFLNMIISNT
jgi:hypothetical protein